MNIPVVRHNLVCARDAARRAMDGMPMEGRPDLIAEHYVRKQLERSALFVFEAMRAAGTFEDFLAAWRTQAQASAE